MHRMLAAEFVGTFVLVLVGCGAIAVDAQTGGTVTHAGIALAFGLAVMTMIYTVGDVSGAHFNPAVTLGFWASGRLPFGRVPAYIAAQCVGAAAAGFLLRAMFQDAGRLGVTLPAGDTAQAVVLEGVLSFILMLVILAVATGAKEKGLMAGVAIGATVTMNALWAGPITGASMNPARSLGPALAMGETASLWIYLLAPVVGALFAVGACKLIHPPGACCVAETPCGTDAASDTGHV